MCYHHEYNQLEVVMAELNILSLRTAPFLGMVSAIQGMDQTNLRPNSGNSILSQMGHFPPASFLLPPPLV